MATKIYDTDTITLFDGTEVFLSPLKIKFLREFMQKFQNVKGSDNDDDAIWSLVECATIAMKQFYPSIKTPEELEDCVDIQMIYKIIEIGANIKINPEAQEEVREQASSEENNSWDEFDLAKLEAELFLLGIWKDYDELESSLSLPELTATLHSKRDLDYQEKKFAAAIQGVDLDEQSGKQNEWEEMKARVFSGGQAENANDILAYQGVNAAKAGFGIGNGIGYEKWD